MRAHILNAFFSVVFAILILSAAASHLTTEATFTVPITITAPEQVEIRYGVQSGNRLALDNVVTVVVRGPSELLERHRQQGTIKGDYSLTPEEVAAKEALSVDTILKKRIPEGITLERVTPATLDLAFSQRETRKVYVSHGEILGEPAPGYRIARVVTTKNLVTAEGDVSLLDKYPGSTQDNPHYKTKPLDLAAQGSAPRSSVTVQLEVVPPDSGIRITETVGVRVVIEPELVVEEIEFPVRFVRNPSEDSIAPLKFRVIAKSGWRKRIKLKGPQATLKRIRDDLAAGAREVPFVFVEAELITTTTGNDDRLDIRVRGLPPDVAIVDVTNLILDVTTERPK